MQYGLGHLSVVPIRASADSSAEMISQLLYGESFKIKEERKYFSKIELAFDKFEGWVQNEQLIKISEEHFKSIKSGQAAIYNSDFLSYATVNGGELLPVLLGSRMDTATVLGHCLDEIPKIKAWKKSNLVDTVLMYLNCPFLKGGRTPFGIDASGLTQMVYKINGQALKRTLEEQSKQGEALSFIEESEAGDLAFFDNAEGIIDHVGIILKDNYIIHAHGHVRIDRLDHTGIFNAQLRRYTHQLRVIKKIA